MQQIAANDIPIAHLIVNRNYNITYANKACHKLFGYDPEELINKHLDILVPINFREYHNIEAEKYWKQPFPKQLGSGRDVQGLKKDGTLIEIEVGLYPYENDIFVSVIDVSIRHAKNVIDQLQYLANKLDQILKQNEKNLPIPL